MLLLYYLKFLKESKEKNMKDWVRKNIIKVKNIRKVRNKHLDNEY